MEEKIFADGFVVKRSDKAPDFVLCNLSIKVDEAVAFLNKHSVNGWVNLGCKRSQAGKFYAELDQWKPDPTTEHNQVVQQAKQQLSQPAFDPNELHDDIPF